MTDGCRVELATEADLDAVAEIDRASFTRPWTREMFAREFRQPGLSRLYVVRTPEALVAGFCVCWHVTDELHINTLAIRPDLRRSGMATRLLVHALAEAACRGASRATLEVRVSNIPALKLYRKLGFEIAGTRPDFYDSPVEAGHILWHDHLDRFLIDSSSGPEHRA